MHSCAPCLQGDFSWKCVHGSSVGLQPVPLQSLSELERVRLQEVAFCRLLDDHDLGCQISLPKGTHTRTHTRIRTHTHTNLMDDMHMHTHKHSQTHTLPDLNI